MLPIVQKSLSFFSKHPMLNSLAHAAGGFGLAVVIQQYMEQNSVVPVWIGWVLIVFSALIHFRSFAK
jgi:hypothetical protein